MLKNILINAYIKKSDENKKAKKGNNIPRIPTKSHTLIRKKSNAKMKDVIKLF